MSGGLIGTSCAINYQSIKFGTLAKPTHGCRMLKIYSAANLPEAHLLLNLLQQAGISAQVLNAYAQGASGEIPFEQAYPQIWLEDERDKLLAEKIITKYEAMAPNTEWIYCRGCGERNPANFEICWQCGKDFERGEF